MRVFLSSAVALVGLLAAVLPSPAASLAQTVSASANIATIAKLALSPASLLFPDADPDLVPSIPSSNGPITITAKARSSPGGQVTLTMLASDDLRSGMDTVPIGALKWTATGDGFVGGTASRTSSQLVAVWAGSGARTGTQVFALDNTWQRATGTYTVTLVYTLTAP
jgi:hypothetical protein